MTIQYRRTAGRAATVVAVLLAPVLLAGCGGGNRDAVDQTSGTQRFLTGDGTGTWFEPDGRAAAPALKGTDLDGAPLSTAAFAGRPYVVNVWGSWCAPCKKEQPDLEQVAGEARALGVGFVGINVRDPSTVGPKAHVRRFGVSYPSFYDPSASLVARFRDVPPTAIPSTFVVDAAGRVAARVFGGIDHPTLLDLVRRVAAEGS